MRETNMKDSEKRTYITPQADIIDIEFPDVICGLSCGGGDSDSNSFTMAEEGNESDSKNEVFLNSVK